ncbi:MAG: DMT family transporter [Tistlia sp.]|uniref:DMT family transporter n=1 Tax=Tistlia sp. TaxID=3057121 RepID=UPI0034A37E3D
MTFSSDPARRRQALLLLLGLVVVWGANWPIMKVGLAYVPPFWFAALRLALGAATLFGLLALLGRLRLPPRADLPVLMSVALLHMAGFLALANLALLTVEAGRSAVLAYTTPLWVAPAAVLLLGERMTRLKALGLLLGLGGLAVLFNPLDFAWQDRRQLFGNGALLLAALLWSAAILHVRRHRWSASPLDLAPWQMLLASALLAAAALPLEGLGWARWSWELGAVLAYNGPLASAFCFWAAVMVARDLPSITTSLGFLGVPLFGVLVSTLWLGEPLSASLLLGLAAILGGLALVNLADQRRARGGVCG